MELRVAVAIRLLAGASYLDLLEFYGMHKTTLYSCLWSVIDAINNTPGVGNIIFPGNRELCEELAVDFEVGSNNSRQSYKLTLAEQRSFSF